MSKESVNIDVFDSYLRGEMPGDKKAQFESALQSDSEMNEAFELYKQSIELTHSAAIGQEVGNLLNKNGSKKKIWLSAAASLVIAMLVSVLLLRVEEPDFYAANFKPYPNVISTRSAHAYSDGLNYYDRGSFKEAVTSFEKLTPKSDTIHFYLAMSHLSLGNGRSAIDNLEEIDSNSIFYPQKLWYAGLAKIKLGQEQEAIPFFIQIKPSSYKYEESGSLIKDLGGSTAAPEEEK